MKKRGLHLLLAIFLVLNSTVLIAGDNDNDPSGRTDTGSPFIVYGKDEISGTEFFTVISSGPDQEKAADEFVQREITDSRKTNPDVKVNEISIDGAKIDGTVPIPPFLEKLSGAAEAASAAPGVLERVNALSHSLVFETLVRFTVNGSVTFVNLVHTRNMPAKIALPIALLTGGMSGLLQVKHETLAKFVATVSGSIREYATKVLPDGSWIRASSVLAAYDLTELPFQGIIFMMEAALGYSPEPTIAKAITNLGLNSTITTVSQGPWDTSVISEARKMKTTGTATPEEAAHYQSNRFLLSSIISVASAVAVMNHGYLGYLGFAFLTVGGYSRAKGWNDKVKATSAGVFKHAVCGLKMLF